MSDVRLVLPAAAADPGRPSGGNVYDRFLATGLAGLGWRVHEHLVPGPWPRRTAAGLTALDEVVTACPDGASVVVDGLVASVADDVLVPECARVRLTVLVHLPLAADPAAGEDVVAREGRVLRRAAGVVATSGWTRDRLVDLHAVDPTTVDVAPPGVRPAPVAPGTVQGTSLLCVGALTPLKGQDLLLDVLAELAALPWSCTWVGSLDVDREYAAGLQVLLADRGLTGRVSLTGPLTPPELALRYAAADLLVVPSRVESYGMVVTEALARGIPVVAADVGGVRESLGRVAGGSPGFLVPPEDVPALAGALRAWLSDPFLRARLRQAALLRRPHLAGWDATARLVARAVGRERDRSRVRLPLQAD